MFIDKLSPIDAGKDFLGVTAYFRTRKITVGDDEAV